jgi:two-component system LytT family response regulator
MSARLRVIIADDERPARSFLRATLNSFEDVALVGEAESGFEAVDLINRTKPDLALLDFDMPELNGLQVAQALRRYVPLIAFVTAFDQHAVQAFEHHAIDYLLKPVDPARLRDTLNRAAERLEKHELRDYRQQLRSALSAHTELERPAILERIPVRRRDDVLLLPVDQIASIVAEGELLHLTTLKAERFTISFRLKDLETRLDQQAFVRLGRGALARVACITRVTFMPGGMQVAILSNGQQLPISRIQSRILRERLLRL